MRRIDPRNFKVATRGTSREINRRIALSLVRSHQPISRADLARLMRTRRSAVGLLVNELIEKGLVFEGATGQTLRGRRPKFLYIDSRQRCVVAVDIRVLRTYVMVTDLVGHQLVSVTSFPTLSDPERFAADLVKRVKVILADHRDLGKCEGVGVVVPGMVEYGTGRVLLAPNLRWRDVQLREPLERGLGLPVHLENSGKACALAQVWSTRNQGGNPPSLVFVSVSDGLGVGVVVGGELLRGQHNIAGEFGHVPINIDGPRCGCGATRVLAGLRLQPRDPLPLLRARPALPEAALPRGGAPHDRGPRGPGARRRRQGGGRGAGDRALPGPGPGRAHQRGGSRSRLPERGDHRGVGHDRGDGARRSRRARAHPVARPARRCRSSRPSSTRACAGRRRSSAAPAFAAPVVA